MFLTDKDGKILNVPDDSNHEWSNSMDAIRYGFNGASENVRAREQQEQQFQINRVNFNNYSNK